MTVFSRASVVPCAVRLLATFATLTVASVFTTGDASAQTASRDPWLRPFAADSIWNTAIGSNATYVSVGLQDAALGGVETDWLIRTGPADPYRQTLFPGDTQRYRAGGTEQSWVGYIRVPDSLIIPDVAGSPGQFGYSAPNHCSAFLEDNGYSMIQFQPTTRLASDGPLWGYPQRDYGESNGGNLFGPGRWGSHYGSGLSAIGGTIRKGELTDTSTRGTIRHALKLLLDMRKYAQYTTAGDGLAGYRWPARQADSYANPAQYGYGYGTLNGGANANANIEQGSLMAIDKTAVIDNLGLTTEKAKKVAWALQNYGGYVVDDTQLDQYLIAVEEGAGSEFDLSLQDINTLFRNLKVVSNNTPTTVGGGGTPRVAAAPRFAYGGSAVGVYTPIANRIEAENYDVGGKDNVYFDTTDANEGGAYRRDGVDVEVCGEGGFNVGYIATGEWLGYSINVPTAGNYNITFRHAGGAGTVRFESYATPNVLVPVNLPATGGYQTWQTSPTVQVNLPAGNQTIYLGIVSGGFNLNYFTIAPVGTATLTNRATGGTATASSNPVTAENAPKAFDGSTGTKWLGNAGTGTVKGWLQYQFGGGAGYAVKQYKVSSANDSADRDPKSWALQGSDNGTSWTTVNTQTNQTFAARAQTNTYNITNTTAYKYYRFNVTATNGSTTLIQLSELQLLSQ